MSELKTITLNKGKAAIVDAEDYELLSKYKWHVVEKGYAARTGRVDGRTRNIFMHRVIMQTPKGMLTDHIDGNRLNNRRSNLRICTAQGNSYNKRSRLNGTSKFKGVTWHKKSGKWQSRIKFQEKTIHLGLFDDEMDAAHTYNLEAPKYFGEFAQLNPVPSGWLITTRCHDAKTNNVMRAKSLKPSTSKYKGVGRLKNGQFVARIKFAGKLKYLGAYDSEDQAAIVYNSAAKAAWGDVAYINQIEGEA